MFSATKIQISHKSKAVSGRWVSRSLFLLLQPRELEGCAGAASPPSPVCSSATSRDLSFSGLIDRAVARAFFCTKCNGSIPWLTLKSALHFWPKFAGFWLRAASKLRTSVCEVKLHCFTKQPAPGSAKSSKKSEKRDDGCPRRVQRRRGAQRQQVRSDSNGTATVRAAPRLR